MASKARILVVDDDPLIRLMVQDTLEQAGYHVDTLDRPRRICAAVTAHRPDLILMDVWMRYDDSDDSPDITSDLQAGGLRALSALAGRWTGPILLMSARFTEAQGARVAGDARGLGVRGFLAKPFDTGALLATIAQTLEEPS